MVNSNKFSYNVAIAFTLNYIIGTGFLTLPWSFNEAGWLLGSITLLLMTIFSIFASNMVVETISRADVTFKLLHGSASQDELCTQQDIQIIEWNGYQSIKKKNNIINDDNVQLNNQNKNSSTKIINFNIGIDGSYDEYDEHIDDIDEDERKRVLGLKLSMVGDKKFEIPELCEMFLGLRGRDSYMLSIVLYLYGTLWAYSTVFATAVSSYIPFNNSYLWYLLLFSFFAVPISLMDLTEQVYVQVTLSLCRVLMLFLMIWTILDAEIYQYNPFLGFNHNDTSNDERMIRFSKLHVLLPIAAFANIFHHAIPGLAQPIIDKTLVSKVFTNTLIICYISYAFIGCIISRYFGNSTCVSANLNWKYYVGINENPSIIIKFISSFIVLFPAIDVSSAFPLNAVTLGDSLMSFFYGSKIHEIENIKPIKVLFRLFAALPPIAAASLNLHLGTITDFTGLAGFIIAFIFPALLAHSSEKFLKQKNFNTLTYYSSWMTRKEIQLLTLGFGIILVIYVVSSFLIFGAPK